jgi:cytochrome c-type biogenesis protein CcmH
MKLLLLSLIIFINFFSFAKKSEKIDSQLRELSGELRCMICQNQSLLDSDSELAKDLKNIIYKKLQEGESKKEIKDFLVKRYGEFILFRPLLNYTNLMLWGSPIIFLLFIGLVAFRKIKIITKK